MNRSSQLLESLLSRAGFKCSLTTSEAAQVLNLKPATLNKWAYTGTGPVKPIKVAGRLAWPAADIAALLTRGDAAASA